MPAQGEWHDVVKFVLGHVRFIDPSFTHELLFHAVGVGGRWPNRLCIAGDTDRLGNRVLMDVGVQCDSRIGYACEAGEQSDNGFSNGSAYRSDRKVFGICVDCFVGCRQFVLWPVSLTPNIADQASVAYGGFYG